MAIERAARLYVEPRRSVEVTGEHSQFRLDLERIRFSPYFSRLSAVTQVIAQPGAGPLIHNRLTHSIKVTAVSRAIAVGLTDASSPARELALEHGCDAVVVQAAASAHDLGHPPFGHLGERVLDRLARETLGLADGFEGNAQTYRIISALDVSGRRPEGSTSRRPCAPRSRSTRGPGSSTRRPCAARASIGCCRAACAGSTGRKAAMRWRS